MAGCHTLLIKDCLVHCLVGTRKGVQLSPLGFAACQSKNCTNRTIDRFFGSPDKPRGKIL